MASNHRVLPLVFLGYLTLSILFTNPILMQAGSHVPGSYDVWTNLWNIWWFKKAVFELKTNPYYTNFVFHPTGTTLAFHTLQPVNSLPAVLLMEAFSLSIPQAYNLLVFLSFVLAGYGTFLLARHVTGNNFASFLAGFIYAFSPYHFFEVYYGHLNTLTVQWLPFYIICLIRAFETRNLRYPIFTGFFFFLCAGSSLQYAVFLFLFTFFYALYLLWSRGRASLAHVSKVFLIITVINFVFSLPCTYPLLSSNLFENEVVNRIQLAKPYNLDFAALFLPSLYHPLLGVLTGKIYEKMWLSQEGVMLSLGYSTVFLIAWLILKEAKASGKTKKNIFVYFQAFTIVLLLCALFSPGKYLHVVAAIFFLSITYATLKIVSKRICGFWLASLVLFTILSLGPFLYVFGVGSLPLPYILLNYIPGFSFIRVPLRMMVLSYLCLSILVAQAVKILLSKEKRKLVYVLVFVIFFEYLTISVPMTQLHSPRFFTEISGDGKDYAILPVPIPPKAYSYQGITFETGLPDFMLYQIFHEKPMIGGYVSYPSEQARSYITDTPLFNCLNSPELIGGGSCVFSSDYATALLRGNNVEFIVLSKVYLGSERVYGPDGFDRVHSWLTVLLPTSRVVYEDDEVRVLSY